MVTYRLSWWRRAANVLIRRLLRLGLAPPHTYLLTVQGRKSHKLYSTPVTLVEEGRERWIVAPYGEVNWVRNARAAGKVTLSRGSKSETVAITEVEPQDAARLLKKYLNRVPITRPFFDAAPDSDLAAFVDEASKHPVFRVRAL
jgi:deazaflavin-dependent oxidoreductase (nitroreductase family)